MPPDQPTSPGKQPVLGYPYNTLPDQEPQATRAPSPPQPATLPDPQQFFQPTVQPAPAPQVVVSKPFMPEATTAAQASGLPDPQQFFQPQTPASQYIQARQMQPASMPAQPQSIYQADAVPENTDSQDMKLLLKLLLIVFSVIAVLGLVIGGAYLALHKSSSASSGNSDSVNQHSISTPCFTTTIPELQSRDYSVTSSNNCDITTKNKAGNDVYEMTAYSVSDVDAGTLADKAKQQTAQLMATNTGTSITGQYSSTLAGSPAYVMQLKNGNGTATIYYAYHPADNGFNFYVIDRFNNAGSSDLGTVTSKWRWN